MKGFQFLAGERGNKRAVAMDLRKNAELCEDFYDRALASSREHEPRESLESVWSRRRSDWSVRSDEPAGEDQIVFVRPVGRELTALPRSVALRVLRRIESSSGVPHPRGGRKLVGATNYWRVRIDDDRVVYAIDGAT